LADQITNLIISADKTNKKGSLPSKHFVSTLGKYSKWSNWPCF
jgi:hypothetical protein